MQQRIKNMQTPLETLIKEYKELGIDQQIDYDKFYLYSLITHSTAIEGSTITELENQIMFDHGISLKGKSIEEQNMNLDLKSAYEKAIQLAKAHTPISIEMLKDLSALVMKNTGKEYKTVLGDFSSAKGDLRLLNVTAGIGGRSYMGYNKIQDKLSEFCLNLNNERQNFVDKNVIQLYNITFDAHYNLVTIHPWADGNGRMARLIMNFLQFEFGLIPTKILKEDKEEYIKALVETRENEDLNIFREFMTSVMIKNLANDIDTYKKSIECPETIKSREKVTKSREKTIKSREKIIDLLSKENTLSAAAIAERIGITPKAVEKQISKLKAEGIIKSVGPDKGGYWSVNGQ